MEAGPPYENKHGFDTGILYIVIVRHDMLVWTGIYLYLTPSSRVLSNNNMPI